MLDKQEAPSCSRCYWTNLRPLAAPVKTNHHTNQQTRVFLSIWHPADRDWKMFRWRFGEKCAEDIIHNPDPEWRTRLLLSEQSMRQKHNAFRYKPNFTDRIEHRPHSSCRSIHSVVSQTLSKEVPFHQNLFMQRTYLVILPAVPSNCQKW